MSSKKVLADVYHYDGRADSWNQVQSLPSPARSLSCAYVTFRSRPSIFCAKGISGKTEEDKRQKNVGSDGEKMVAVYDLTAGRWHRLRDKANTDVRHSLVHIVGRKIYFFNGMNEFDC